MIVLIFVLLFLLILVVLYLFFMFHLLIKEKEKNLDILENRNMLIKDSLRCILYDMEDIEKKVSIKRERPIEEDFYYKWLFDKEEE